MGRIVYNSAINPPTKGPIGPLTKWTTGIISSSTVTPRAVRAAPVSCIGGAPLS